MADRKRTPDVLAELLSADLPPAEPTMAPTPPTAAAREPAKRQAPPREPRSRPEAGPEPAPDLWQVEIVSFQEHRGWRPRFVNGVELKDWLSGAPIHDYVNQRGADGWELAAATTAPHLYGVADGLQLYFRKRTEK